jgi:hypothetical protein
MAKFRAVTEADRPLIERWIADDPGHRGIIEADQFLKPGRFHSLYCVEDEEGPTMFVRQEVQGMKTRLYIQFGPDRKRIVKTVKEGFPKVIDDARKRGFVGIVFDTASPALAKFFLTVYRFRAELEMTL